MILDKRKFVSIIVLAVLIIHFFPVGVMGVSDIQDLQDELEMESEASPYKSDLTINFIKLLLVVVLITGAAWSIVKIFGQKAGRKLQGNWIHIVDEVMLGQNRGIVLCEIGEKIYALGVTDNNITMLFEVNNQKLLQEVSQSEYGDSAWGNFELNSQINRLFKRNKTVSNNNDFSALIQEQNQRFKDQLTPEEETGEYEKK